MARLTGDEFELLCERCGYSIEGLPASGACPECSRAIATSLPGARGGTPWQRRRSPAGWAATGLALLARPRGTFRRVRVDRASMRLLRWVNITVAAVVVGVTLAVAQARFGVLESFGIVRNSKTGGRGVPDVEVVKAVVLGAVVAAAWAPLLFVLTEVERAGIRFFGRVHRSRITSTVATVVTSHATFGWVVGAVLMAVGLALGSAAHGVAMTRNVDGFRGVLMLAPAWMPVVAAFLGLLAFETVVYIGVLGCRFANRARGAGEGPPGGAPDPGGRVHPSPELPAPEG